MITGNLKIASAIKATIHELDLPETFDYSGLLLLPAKITLVWTLGIMAMAGLDITINSNFIPVLLLSIGSVYTIHEISPLSGAIIVTDWEDIKENYALAYMPEIIYQATVNTEISLSSVFFDGKGNILFANMKGYDMFMLKIKYIF